MKSKNITIALNETGIKALDELKELSGYKVNTKALLWAIQSAVSLPSRVEYLERKLEESRQSELELNAVIRHLDSQ